MLLLSVCHVMPFSACALKKNLLFDIDIVVKDNSKCGFSMVCILFGNNMRHHSGQNLLLCTS